MKIQSSSGPGVKATCVDEDTDEWDAIVRLSVLHHVKTIWQSFGFFISLFIFKCDDNNNHWHASLHKKRLTLIWIILALCSWDVIEIPSRVSHLYVCWFPLVGHKRVTLSLKAKQSNDRSMCCLFYFFFFFAVEKGDYMLLLFAAVGERKSEFALRVSCLLLHCVNC